MKATIQKLWTWCKETLPAVAVNGFVIYLLTDAGFWACAFGGYLIAELFSSANKIRLLEKQMRFAEYELTKAAERIDQLENDVFILRDRVDIS